MEPAKEKYITVQTVAERLSCTERYVYMLIQEGRLPAIKLGERALRISESDFDKFVSASLVNPADYFGPADEDPQPQRQQTAARSTWMSK